MDKKSAASIGLLLLFLASSLSGSTDKKKKTYELIYKDVQLIKEKILNLEKKINQNTRDIESMKEQLKEIISMNRQFRSEQASFMEQQKQIPAQYQVLLEKLESLNTQISDFSEELIEIKQASPLLSPEQVKEEKGETAKDEQTQETLPPTEKEKEGGKEEKEQEKAPISPQLSPQEVYNTARSDYLKGNYQLAVEGFQLYLGNFPQSPLADNAVYWIGECYFSQEDYERALEQFNNLILNYPQGDKVPAAYLKKGISLNNLGEKQKALAVFKLLVSKFPLEEETKIAQEKIKELK